MVIRPRDKRGRYLTLAAGRKAKLPDLARSLPALARAVLAESPPRSRLHELTIYSIEIEFHRSQSWARLIRIMLDADIRKVPKTDRVRYQICARNTAGDVKPLSRAYASAELALGEAIAMLEGETVLSPKEGDDNLADTMWNAIVCNCYLRKDAMR